MACCNCRSFRDKDIRYASPHDHHCRKKDIKYNNEGKGYVSKRAREKVGVDNREKGRKQGFPLVHHPWEDRRGGRGRMVRCHGDRGRSSDVWLVETFLFSIFLAWN